MSASVGERVRLTGVRAVTPTFRDRMADLVGQWPCTDLGAHEMARLRKVVDATLVEYRALRRHRMPLEVEMGALLALWPTGRVQANDEVHQELSAQARELYGRWWGVRRAEVEPRPSAEWRALRRYPARK